MGMFDSVNVRCKCGHEVEFQTKVGECNLSTFDANEVPIAIALDLDGQSRMCTNCESIVTVEYPKTHPLFVNMKVSFA